MSGTAETYQEERKLLLHTQWPQTRREDQLGLIFETVMKLEFRFNGHQVLGTGVQKVYIYKRSPRAILDTSNESFAQMRLQCRYFEWKHDLTTFQMRILTCMKENPNWNVNFSFSPLLQTMDEKIV